LFVRFKIPSFAREGKLFFGDLEVLTYGTSGHGFFFL
jgi:hypothetical protein